MKKLKSILIIVGVIIVGFLIGCSNKQQTPIEFVEKLFKESNPNKYVYFINHNDEVYDDNEKIKDEYLEECLETSESIRTGFKAMSENANITYNEINSITAVGWGELKVVRMFIDYEYIDLYLLPTGKTYELFFNSSLGNNNISFLEYKVGNDTTTPLSFRVKANLSDYYNYSYRDKEETYYSINLYDGFSRRDSVTGYVEKDSSIGEALFNILRDGEEHSIIVTIHIPSNEKISNDIVIIDELISDSWVYPRDYVD